MGQFRALRLRNRAFQSLHIEDLFHDRAALSVKFFHDAIFNIAGEAFIQPRIAPIRIRHKIARPAMRELMGDNIGEGFIAGDEGRRHKG